MSQAAALGGKGTPRRGGGCAFKGPVGQAALLHGASAYVWSWDRSEGLLEST